MLLFLASSQAAHITGQCIGIGGDKLSLWSQPTEVRVAYRDGGWDAESIARTWAQGVGQQLEPFGDDIKLPE